VKTCGPEAESRRERSTLVEKGIPFARVIEFQNWREQGARSKSGGQKKDASSGEKNRKGPDDCWRGLQASQAK